MFKLQNVQRKILQLKPKLSYYLHDSGTAGMFYAQYFTDVDVLHLTTS